MERRPPLRLVVMAGLVGWANKESQVKANQSALGQCAKGTKTNDCKLYLQKGIVKAEGGGRVGYGWSETSLLEAKKALSSCVVTPAVK